GVFPYILPANGTLLQEIYFPEDSVPDQILLRVETGYLGSPNHQRSVFVQARWTKDPEEHFATENRPRNFWAGTFSGIPGVLPTEDRRTLTVNLVDIGLCGRNRSIRGIEYIVVGGQARFGRTIIQRPAVEIRGTKKYHLFSEGEQLAFDVAMQSFSNAEQRYTLDLRISDYQGSELLHTIYRFDIPGKTSRHK
ncbi:MAG: hypothetical protein GY792_09015, partial [Gammaproteobacteria bacterium]|nr:hypothetical protein [Gammaproteobacteria bacterium]